MKRSTTCILLALAGLLGFVRSSLAAAPPPEQLLPANTIGMITIPDWDSVAAFSERSSLGSLWRDPALKPFKDHFLKRFEEDVLKRFERELGIQFADYADLVHGQVTFAVTPGGADGSSEQKPGILLLIDSKGQAERLRTQWAALKKKWVDSGKQIKTEKIRDVEFTTFLVQQADVARTLEKAFPAPDAPKTGEAGEAEKKEGHLEVIFGQSDSLLLVGSSTKELEKILIRQSGGAVLPLAEQADYEANHSALFRDALAYGWMNFKPIYDLLLREVSESAKSGAAGNLMGPSPEKILAAIGLGGLKTVAFKFGGSAEGSAAELFLGVPEGARQGIFKILVAEAKDASPSPFVSAETVKYSRWRLDGQKAWAAIESMIASISPEVANLFQMTMSTLGKDKDPNFDLKKNLIGNLGDDFIVLEKNPRAATLADLSSPPSLFLIGSPNAEKLAQAISAGTSMFSLATGATQQEREFLGRKIYSFPLPVPPGGDAGKTQKLTLSYAASGGYVALSTDIAMLEEFLRSNEASGKTLRETPGLIEAAQRVGGMSTGLFGFENQSETMRVAFETLKNNIDQLEKLFDLPILKGKLSGGGDVKDMKDWFDFSLLPSFDRIAKYFHFVVYSGNANASGLSWKMFAPTPPQLRQ
ncbi:MAG: hypothetical protein HY735_24500 [Verrucomicrobia bacterium]|nr:hypothetical protein [Verrucomicrobiota bacterium]